MFDLDPNQEEIDLAYDHIFQMISASSQYRDDLSGVLSLVVLEFDMETICDADLHFDACTAVRWHAIRVNPEFAFLDHLAAASHKCNADKVAEIRVL